ncbi:hypothetical protein [Saccharopolyspora phatthalungensis]|uniref:Uncharacterized protein n=1 Tax=Saccharopolyspora phatthalungensis TaxID=664693 RepID=A0A840QA51_9PSEU|nr:hypothetical protein [Saccharopolyspora phatthalungensis]MBB5156827.1 hypothetical protein [Saccharopolyspora phatthalungensis]
MVAKISRCAARDSPTKNAEADSSGSRSCAHQLLVVESEEENGVVLEPFAAVDGQQRDGVGGFEVVEDLCPVGGALGNLGQSGGDGAGYGVKVLAVSCGGGVSTPIGWATMLENDGYDIVGVGFGRGARVEPRWQFPCGVVSSSLTLRAESSSGSRPRSAISTVDTSFQTVVRP